jgi:hypothetical protein
MEEDFVVKVMTVRVEKAKHDDDEDNAITANDASNAVAAALRLMNMAVDGSTGNDKNLVEVLPQNLCVCLWGCCQLQ